MGGWLTPAARRGNCQITKSCQWERRQPGPGRGDGDGLVGVGLGVRAAGLVDEHPQRVPPGRSGATAVQALTAGVPVQQLHRRRVEVHGQAGHAQLAGLRVNLRPGQVEHDRRGNAVDADEDHGGVQPVLGGGVEDGLERGGAQEARRGVGAGSGRDMEGSFTG